MGKPEALFLAQELEAPLGTVISSEVDRRAAAELRRLHDENEMLRKQHLEAHRTAAALASAMTAISLRTHLGGEVAEYGDVVDAVRRLHIEHATLTDSCAAKADRIDRLGEMVQRLQAEKAELLEALRKLLFADDQEWDAAVVRARAAIARAEGEKT